MNGKQTAGPRSDGLPDAVARLLADDPAAAAGVWQNLGPTTAAATAAADAAATWILDPAPEGPSDLGNRTITQLPGGSPDAYGRLGAAVLDAWTDRDLRERWRADACATAASLGLPQPIPRLVRVVGPAEGRLPRPDVITVPLPPPGAPTSTRAAALRDLAATEFGWLLAGVPGGREALGLVLPDGAAASGGHAPGAATWRQWLRPHPLLLTGGVVCLVAAIGLSVSAGGDASLAGATIGPDAAWRLPAAALSLLLGLALIVIAARRR